MGRGRASIRWLRFGFGCLLVCVRVCPHLYQRKGHHPMRVNSDRGPEPGGESPANEVFPTF